MFIIPFSFSSVSILRSAIGIIYKSLATSNIYFQSFWCLLDPLPEIPYTVYIRVMCYRMSHNSKHHLTGRTSLGIKNRLPS